MQGFERMEIDPWYSLNFGYENDAIARFELVLDAVDDVAARLVSPKVADLRVALIITDYAADVLLTRRVASVLSLSEGSVAFGPRERFDAHARQRIKQRFNRRVTLATTDYKVSFNLGAGSPILDSSDAEVLRVAHAYRNDAYHEDRHNSGALPTIVRTALHAVVRAWVRSQSPKSATSEGAEGPVMARLVEKGYETPAVFGRGGPMFSLHEGARTVESWLCREMPPDKAGQVAILSGDIEPPREVWRLDPVRGLGDDNQGQEVSG